MISDKIVAVVFLWAAATAVQAFVNSYPHKYSTGLKVSLYQQAFVAMIGLFIWMLYWSISVLVG